MIDLSASQKIALEKAVKWFKQSSRGGSSVFRLFGYAGTGKTSVLKAMIASLGLAMDEVRFVAPTGKAARVMAKAVGAPAETIHAAYYKPRVIVDDRGNESIDFRFRETSEGCKLIVIDECSMVTDEIFNQVVSLGVPIVLLGDPGQLPPVSGSGSATMGSSDVTLTEIHRQSDHSSIVDIAELVRDGKRLDEGDDGAGVRVVEGRRAKGRVEEALRIAGLGVADLASFDQVIVGTNELRANINLLMLEYLGLQAGVPVGHADEKIIVTRNHKDSGFANGDFIRVCREPGRGRLQNKLGNFLDAPVGVSAEDDPFSEVKADLWLPPFVPGLAVSAYDKSRSQRCLQADWGWAITAHKSQGSQWKKVLVFDQSSVFRSESRRWLYTAVTRAREELTVIRF